MRRVSSAGHSGNRATRAPLRELHRVRRQPLSRREDNFLVSVDSIRQYENFAPARGHVQTSLTNLADVEPVPEAMVRHECRKAPFRIPRDISGLQGRAAFQPGPVPQCTEYPYAWSGEAKSWWPEEWIVGSYDPPPFAIRDCQRAPVCGRRIGTRIGGFKSCANHGLPSAGASSVNSRRKGRAPSGNSVSISRAKR